MTADFDDDLTPTALMLPPAADLPMEFALMKRTLEQQARAIREIRKDRTEARKSLRNIQFTLLGVIGTMIIAASGALLQMGQYIERIDSVAASQIRVEERLNDFRRHQPNQP